MNIKKIFGELPTALGIGGLIYAAVLYVNTPNGSNDVKSLVIYGVSGLLFFISVIKLIRTTNDESSNFCSI